MLKRNLSSRKQGIIILVLFLLLAMIIVVYSCLKKVNNKIKVQINIVDLSDQPLANFPIRFELPNGLPEKAMASRIEIHHSNENGIIEMYAYPGGYIYLHSGNPDWVIHDNNCEFLDSVDCYFDYKNFRGTSENAEIIRRKKLCQENDESLVIRRERSAKEDNESLCFKEYAVGHRIKFEKKSDIKKVVLKVKQDKTEQQENGSKEEQTEEIIEYIEDGEIDTSGWLTYRNESCGFEIKYPSRYLKNNYAIWKGDKQWGVNQYQETIISIKVYPIENKDAIFQNFEYSFLNNKIILSNNIIAKKIKGRGCETWYIKHKDNFYIISSSFCFNSRGAELEYSEYRNIMNSIKFDK